MHNFLKAPMRLYNLQQPSSNDGSVHFLRELLRLSQSGLSKSRGQSLYIAIRCNDAANTVIISVNWSNAGEVVAL